MWNNYGSRIDADQYNEFQQEDCPKYTILDETININNFNSDSNQRNEENQWLSKKSTDGIPRPPMLYQQLLNGDETIHRQYTNPAQIAEQQLNKRYLDDRNQYPNYPGYINYQNPGFGSHQMMYPTLYPTYTMAPGMTPSPQTDICAHTISHLKICTACQKYQEALLGTIANDLQFNVDPIQSNTCTGINNPKILWIIIGILGFLLILTIILLALKNNRRRR